MTKQNPTGLHPLVVELRALRIQAGMSMGELARKSGLNLSTISEMEAGHYWPTLKSLGMYASAMGVKLALKDMKVVLIDKEEKP
jgi:transcriptional regulator with XRE-family HTH domain